MGVETGSHYIIQANFELRATFSWKCGFQSDTVEAGPGVWGVVQKENIHLAAQGPGFDPQC